MGQVGVSQEPDQTEHWCNFLPFSPPMFTCKLADHILLCIWGDRFNILCPNKQFCAQERTKFLPQEDSPVQKLHRTFHLIPWTYPHTCNVTKYKGLKFPWEEFLFTFKLSCARRLFSLLCLCTEHLPKRDFLF